MNLRLLLGGLKSYLPIQFEGYKGTGGTVTGAYCYSVWLRHLSVIARHVPHFRPRVMVELGPGDSIGVGLAALLSGVDRYVGLDVLDHARTETNLRVLDELVALFRQRAPVPGERDFPLLHPRLASYEYPSELVDDMTLDARLEPAFLQRIRSAIETPSNGAGLIQYHAPWSARDVQTGSADLVFSHGALQDMDHTAKRDDLTTNLSAMARWLKPGGVMSSHIELACPGGVEWNHHWAYGDLPWAIVRGRRPYYLNRVPLSEYLRLLEQMDCRVVGLERFRRDGITRAQAAARFRQLPEDDFHTAAALVVAVKR